MKLFSSAQLNSKDIVLYIKSGTLNLDFSLIRLNIEILNLELLEEKKKKGPLLPKLKIKKK